MRLNKEDGLWIMGFVIIAMILVGFVAASFTSDSVNLRVTQGKIESINILDQGLEAEIIMESGEKAYFFYDRSYSGPALDQLEKGDLVRIEELQGWSLNVLSEITILDQGAF
jgi:hypothetical protein